MKVRNGKTLEGTKINSETLIQEFFDTCILSIIESLKEKKPELIVLIPSNVCLTDQSLRQFRHQLNKISRLRFRTKIMKSRWLCISWV